MSGLGLYGVADVWVRFFFVLFSDVFSIGLLQFNSKYRLTSIFQSQQCATDTKINYYLKYPTWLYAHIVSLGRRAKVVVQPSF